MASKLSLALVFVCFLQVCLSARIPRGLKDSDSSEGLTMEDVNQIERQLAAVMPPKTAERLANIMRKFTKDASSAESVDGVMQLFAMALAGNSGKSEQEWQQVLKGINNQED